MIIISSKEKESTIRVKEKTKKMLEALTKGKESHNETLQRILILINQMSNENGTQITTKGRITNTEYQRTHKQFDIKHDKEQYSVICTYNDLTIINMMRNNRLLRATHNNKVPEWEVDLEIVNIKTNQGEWHDPSHESINVRKFLYFICLKTILEDFFDILIYEITSDFELTDTAKWEEIYKKHNFSRESLESDIYQVKKQLRIE